MSCCEMASGLQGAAGKGEVSWNEAGMLQGTVRVGCLPRDLHLNSQKVYAGLTEKKIWCCHWEGETRIICI